METIKKFCLKFVFFNLQFLEKPNALVEHCKISGSWYVPVYIIYIDNFLIELNLQSTGEEEYNIVPVE